MKTIKINEKQARMLKEISEPKVMKVTKEQYNTILEMERMKEIDLVSNEGDNFDIIKTDTDYYISNRTTKYSPQDTAHIGSVQEIGNDKKKLCVMADRAFELFEGISEGLYEDRRAEYEDMKNNAIGSEPYQQACKINMSEFISDPAHPISMAFRRELNEEGSIREMYEEFVNELYNVNEGGEIKYESLIKLMETVGLIENRRIKKESFRNDKAVVEKVISAGLYEMCNGGSKYKAMEAMEEALNVDPSFVSSKTGKSPEELKAFIDAKRVDSNKLVTKNDIERDRMNSKMVYDPESEYVRDEAVDALVDGMKGDQQEMKKETITKIKEEGNRDNWKGDEILNHPMLAKLPTDVMKADNSIYFKLPSLDGGHSATLATHIGHVMDWISDLKSIVQEIPVVDSEMNVLNKGYVGRDIEKLRAISNHEREYGDRKFNTDETTADSSGQSTGPLGGPSHKSNVVSNLDVDEMTSMGGTNGVGGLQANGNSMTYDAPGLKKNNFMMAGNKENKSESVIDNTNEEITEDAFSSTQYPGGTIVTPKEKCKKFPYCDEGPGNFDEKKTKESVISNDTNVYETIAKKTGRTISEIKEIIENSIN
jgi:hypothetical protein